MKAKDFRNKKITIIGLGLHDGGVGTAKYFCELGAKVLVTDLRSKEELKKSIDNLKGYPIKYVLGQHRSEDFINTDLVIKNPAVSSKSKYLQIARDNKVPVDTDVGIFFELCPTVIIGITGSKGKSTTATLIKKILQQKYSDTILAGNIRTSVLYTLGLIKKNTPVVLELSSWQLAGLYSHKKSPHIAVVTNILNDHQNSYKNMEDYILDKKEIFKWQKSKDITILNYDDKTVREMANEIKKSKITYYTGENSIICKCTNNGYRGEIGAYAKGDKIYFNNKEICSFDEIKIKGQHNISNILAAISVVKEYNISDKIIKKVLSKFKGVEGRLETITTIKGVRYINDTTATIPEATLAGLSSFSLKDKIILIAGGADKKLDFSQLSKVIAQKIKTLVLLDGTATPILQNAVKNELLNTKKQLNIIGPMDSMKKAVNAATENAEEGDIILLSPACASFGMFTHEFDRGDQFKKAVENLI